MPPTGAVFGARGRYARKSTRKFSISAGAVEGCVGISVEIPGSPAEKLVKVVIPISEGLEPL